MVFFSINFYSTQGFLTWGYDTPSNRGPDNLFCVVLINVIDYLRVNLCKQIITLSYVNKLICFSYTVELFCHCVIVCLNAADQFF